MESELDFLREKVYLPGYMTIRNFDSQGEKGIFEFNPIEFLVSPIEAIDYLTPRGLHLCLSQSTYALGESLIRQNSEELLNLRKALLEGRVKITELNQKFRKEVKVNEILTGMVHLNYSRNGKIPIFQWDFNFGNNSIKGSLTTIVSQSPLPQINKYLSRLD